MAIPVKVSDRLLALARKEAESTHRSATAQIEHWATLGRAVEVLAAYRDVLALKRVGNALPMPTFVPREAVHDVLAALVAGPDRERVKARIRAAGGPLYTADGRQPGGVAEIEASGRRTPGRLVHRRFVPARRKAARKRT
jgi:ParD-like antitoxin of type II bacterial toxin-antitoxin system